MKDDLFAMLVDSFEEAIAGNVKIVRLTGMTEAEVWEHWNKTLGTNHPFPDDFDDDTPDDGA